MELNLFKAIAEGAEPMALATLLAVKGSSPRHAGAKMLLGARSGRLGTVGGGQGEARALEACRSCLEGGLPTLLRVEMTGTDVNAPAMVCGGTSTMLVESLEDRTPYRAALERLSRGERVLFVKRILDGAPVETALFDQDGKALHGQARATEAQGIARALGAGQPRFEEDPGVFFDPLCPEEKLLILGAGHVGKAMAALAPALGFRVTVVDDRPEFLAPSNFPAGVQTLQAGFEEAIGAFPFDGATYAVVVSRGHLQDLECVRALLKRKYRYAGFIGSARKTRFIFDQVLQDGHDPAQVEALWAPIGLDIAAETPAELAIAILGELIAVRRNAGILPELKRALSARRA